MSSLPFPLFTIMPTPTILGPLAPDGPWSHVELFLDLATATAEDGVLIRLELSEDGGATWAEVARSAELPEPDETVVHPSWTAEGGRPPAGILVRALVASIRLVDSTGGDLNVV